MARIALKIDIDTHRGTREGVPRLADVLQRLDARATFLFSLGPDHTGRAIRRVFRRGFVGKVRRTSVVQHYGVKTLLYGVLLPGPHIGKRNAAIMRDIANRNFEVGVHTYDHSKWQDNVAHADADWTRRELARAHAQFVATFGFPPSVHGAAGWQMNAHVPRLEHELGFRYASDTRGTGPFLPVMRGVAGQVPQLPTTLPTLDELLGRTDLARSSPVEELLGITARTHRDHVFTLHAELEGGHYLSAFEHLLKGWRDYGYELVDLATQFKALDPARLPLHEVISGSVPGRAGKLAMQGLYSGALSSAAG
ncbi:MAG TPA: polysaccharide deacetylase family protein [Steroidobacteraceae bacterium]|nr:polysaccharide deacetylase family protein [Steroidobacteraceae bacterium]